MTVLHILLLITQLYKQGSWPLKKLIAKKTYSYASDRQTLCHIFLRRFDSWTIFGNTGVYYNLLKRAMCHLSVISKLFPGSHSARYSGRSLFQNLLQPDFAAAKGIMRLKVSKNPLTGILKRDNGTNLTHN